jgi:uncharacterized membrane protein
MSRKNFWLAWLLGISLLVNISLVGGFIYHRHFMPPPPEPSEQAQRTLQLTNAQRETLQKLQGEIRNESRESMQVMRERHVELVQLMRRDQLDLPALEVHLRATTEPQVAMQRDVILRLLTFRDTLNPDQKKIFNEKMQRPGFMLHLAGFPGPMWRPHGCHNRRGPGDEEKFGPDEPNSFEKRSGEQRPEEPSQVDAAP